MFPFLSLLVRMSSSKQDCLAFDGHQVIGFIRLSTPNQSRAEAGPTPKPGFRRRFTCSSLNSDADVISISYVHLMISTLPLTHGESDHHTGPARKSRRPILGDRDECEASCESDETEDFDVDIATARGLWARHQDHQTFTSVWASDLGGIRTVSDRYVLEDALLFANPSFAPAISRRIAEVELLVAAKIDVAVTISPSCSENHSLSSAQRDRARGTAVAELVQKLAHTSGRVLLQDSADNRDAGFAVAVLLGLLGVSINRAALTMAQSLYPAGSDVNAALTNDAQNSKRTARCALLRRVLASTEQMHGSLVRFALSYGADAADLGELRFAYLER